MRPPPPTPITTTRPHVAMCGSTLVRLGAPDQLEHDVVRRLRALVSGRQHHVGAQRGHLLAPVGVAHRGRDDRTGLGGQLHGRGPDPAGGARDQDALAHLELGLAEEAVVGGGEDLGEAPRFGPRQAVGDREGVGLVDERHGGLRPAAHDGHDPVAGSEERHLPAHRHHLTGELHARDVDGPPRRRRVEAGPLHQVRRIQSGRPHRHQELGVAGDRVVPLFPVQLALPDHDSVHAAHPTRPGHADTGPR